MLVSIAEIYPPYEFRLPKASLELTSVVDNSSLKEDNDFVSNVEVCIVYIRNVCNEIFNIVGPDIPNLKN